MSLPRFIKHFTLAGAGFTPTAPLLARGLGAVAWYWAFLEPLVSGSDFFGEPIPILRDPTLKAHFSNLAGRAFADFLGREIGQAWATLSYEGALIQSGVQVVGPRPDLLAVNPSWVVALEAKGYAKRWVSDGEMSLHKQQANEGPIPKDSWAASVAYALYDAVRVKYLDPEHETPTPTAEFTRNLLGTYLDLVAGAGEELGRQERTSEGRDVWVVPLEQAVRGRVPLDVDTSDVLNRIELLIERDHSGRRAILEQPNQPNQTERRPVERPSVVSTERVFIDSDGIGIAVR